MPTIQNPYGYVSPIGASLDRLAKTYLSSLPSKSETALRNARVSALEASRQKDMEAVQAAQRKAGAYSDIADIFGGIQGQMNAPLDIPEGMTGPRTEAVAPAQANRTGEIRSALPGAAADIATAGARGGLDPKDVAGMWRFFVPNTVGDGSTNARAFLGAGDALDPGKAYSPEDLGALRDQMADQSIAEILAKAYASPVSTSAGATTTFAPDDPRASEYGQVQGRDTESTAKGRLVNRVVSGEGIPEIAQVLVGIMDKARNPANPFTKTEVEGQLLQGMSPEEQRVAVLGQPAYGPSQSQAEAEILQSLDPKSQAAVAGPSETQAKGQVIAQFFDEVSGMSPEQQRLLGADGGASTPRNYLTPEGLSGTTLDGTTDASDGAPLPKGTVVFTGQVQPSSPGDLTLSNRTSLNNEKIAISRFNTLLDQTEAMAKENPMNFGFPGFVKGTVQDVQAMAEGVSQALGYKDVEEAMTQMRAEIARNPDIDPSLFSGVFDPTLPALQTMSDLLVFSAAEALAGQQGRGISDRDVKLFKGIVGDPQQWAMTQPKFLAKMQTLRDIVTGRGSVADAFMAGQQPKVGETPASPQRIRIDESGNIIQ